MKGFWAAQVIVGFLLLAKPFYIDQNTRPLGGREVARRLEAAAVPGETIQFTLEALRRNRNAGAGLMLLAGALLIGGGIGRLVQLRRKSRSALSQDSTPPSAGGPKGVCDTASAPGDDGGPVR